MWSHYEKSFTFRDCHDEEMMKDNITAVNRLFNESGGICISSGNITTSLADNLEIVKCEDSGEKILRFWNGEKIIANCWIPSKNYIQLSFDIEENLIEYKILVHGCEVKEIQVG